MTLKQGSKVKFNIAKDLQTTISKKLFSHSKSVGPMIKEILALFVIPPFDMKYVIGQTFGLQNKAKTKLEKCFC